jgi:hypothetical protein
MAQDPDKQREELLDAIKVLTQSVEENSKKLDDAVKKQVASREEAGRGRKRLLDESIRMQRTNQIQNLRLVGSLKAMMSLHGILGNVKSGQDDLVKALARSGQEVRAVQGDTVAAFKAEGVSMQQAIATIGDVVDMGMSRFGKETQVLAAQLKMLNISNKAFLGQVRFNTQMLGLTESASHTLTESLIDTAISFGESANSIVDAVSKIKTALVGAANVFGPQAAGAIQSAISMLARGQEELRGPLADFAASLFGGTAESLIKRRMLGVADIQGMSGPEVARELSRAMDAIVARGGAEAGGGGSELLIGAFERMGMFNQSQLNLARRLLNVTEEERRFGLEQAATQASRLSFEQAWQVALFDVQKIAMETLTKISGLASKYLPLLAGLAVGKSIFGLVSAFVPALRGVSILKQGISGLSRMIRGPVGKMGPLPAVTGLQKASIATLAGVTAAGVGTAAVGFGNRARMDKSQFEIQSEELQEQLNQQAEDIRRELNTQTSMMKENKARDTVPQNIREVRDAMREFLLGMNAQVRETERTNEIISRPGKTGTNPFQLKKEASG